MTGQTNQCLGRDTQNRRYRIDKVTSIDRRQSTNNAQCRLLAIPFRLVESKNLTRICSD